MIEELREAMVESWQSFRSLDYMVQKWILGGILAVVVTILAWKVMLPLVLSAIGITSYLRLSRNKDAL
ncbi:MAG: hypothetical protein WAK29_03355 [Terriglobales bacterium]